jgi:hypothetical protein
VARGATIRFSNNPADFIPVVLTRFEAHDMMK